MQTLDKWTEHADINAGRRVVYNMVIGSVTKRAKLACATTNRLKRDNKMKLSVLFFVLLAFACGQEPLTDCDFNNVTGVYKAKYKTLSGTCGDIPDEIANLNDTSDDCVYSVNDRNETECRIDTAFTCRANGYTVKYVSHLDMTEHDGSKLEGEMYVVVEGECSGTYEIKVEKL